MKILKHITLVILSCLIMVSSTGFSMYKHYCGDILKEIRFFDESDACHETEAAKKQSENCPFHQHNDGNLDNEDNCCSDEYSRIALEDQLKYPDNNQQKIKVVAANQIISSNNFLNAIPRGLTSILFTQIIPINGPPLYLLFKRFNFYG